MAPAMVQLHTLVVRNTKLLRAAWRHAAKLIQNRLPEAIRPTREELLPILARNTLKHPLHRLALLKQNKGRWYTTHSAISSAIRRFTSSAARSSVKVDKFSSPKSHIGSIITAQAGRAPFASTLRPNLTGGTLGRTAGGYGWGSGRTRGARYFSHGADAPAQVMQNVSQAVRAFLVGGHKAQFDGVNSRNGEKRFKTVAVFQDSVDCNRNQMPKIISGSYIGFNINPTITALTPMKAVQGFASFAREAGSLNSEGLLDVLSKDFSRAVKELDVVLGDLQRLSPLGDLPLSFEHSTLKVHFPGCDAQSVETICNEFQIQRGVVHQEENLDLFIGTELPLHYPFAPSRTSSECDFHDKPVTARQVAYPVIDWQHMLSPSTVKTGTYSAHTEQSFDRLDSAFDELDSRGSSLYGFDNLHISEASESDITFASGYSCHVIAD